MALYHDTLPALTEYYHQLLAQSTLNMDAEQKQAHAELIDKVSQDVTQMRVEGLSTLNDLMNSQKGSLLEATKNLSPTANDSAYSTLIESVGRGLDMLETLITLPY